MGQLLARAVEMLAKAYGQKDLRILMLGLDAAGKTTVLYKLRLGEQVNTIPTIGFNVETVHHRNVSFTVWDVGGQDRIRQMWKYYFQGTQGLIWVIDSNDPERAAEARDELRSLMFDPELQNVVLLVLANKSDLPNAMNIAELTDRLQLRSYNGKTWFIQSCCATTGDGLHNGLDWLSSALKNLP